MSFHLSLLVTFMISLNLTYWVQCQILHKFDEKIQRYESLKTDKFVLISHIGKRFIENIQNSYKPDMNLTVDDETIPYKSRI